jgi:flotillin
MSVSNTCENAAAEDVFSLIAEGGANFAARVDTYQKAKREHDRSLAALQLGRLTKNALTEAENLKAATKAEAEAVLAKAEADAHKIKADANAYAERLITEANLNRSAVDAHIAQLKRDAEDWVKNHKADLVGKLERLRAAIRAVE